MDTVTTINALFFALASGSCVLGVITGIIRIRTSHVKPLHTFAVIVLGFLSLVYGMAALARFGLIASFSLLKNGMLTSLGVFLLSFLFIIMFVVGCKHYDR